MEREEQREILNLYIDGQPEATIKKHGNDEDNGNFV